MRVSLFVLALVVVGASGATLRQPSSNATQYKGPTRVFPIITSMSPRTGVFTGGTYVTIRGQKLDGTTHCRFGLNAMPALKVTTHTKRVSINAVDQNPEPEHTVICETPAQDPGPVSVQVSKDGDNWFPIVAEEGENGEDAVNTYTFYEIPEVVDMRPTHGPAAGGTHFRISVVAKGFENSPDQESAMIMVGDNATTVEEIECIPYGPCYLKAVVPQICFWPSPGCAAKAPVYVSLNGQDFTQDPNNKLTYQYDNEWIYASLLEEDSVVVET